MYGYPSLITVLYQVFDFKISKWIIHRINEGIRHTMLHGQTSKLKAHKDYPQRPNQERISLVA